MAEFKEAGRYSLESFRIETMDGKKSREIKALVHTWSISESINSDCVYGSATIYDGAGLFYDFPLRGEEFLTIEYVDYFDEMRKDTFFLTAVTDIKPTKQGASDMMRYNIHFVSVGKFSAETRMVRKGYSGQISDFVASLYEEAFMRMPGGSRGTDKQIEIEPTIGDTNLVVPNYSASETMNFFARNAYGGKNETSTYRFFERRDQYFFATVDYMFDREQFTSIENQQKTPAFEWGIHVDETPEGQYRKMQNISEFLVERPIDTMADLQEGAYYKKSAEIDYILKQYSETSYELMDNIPDYNAFLGLKNGVKPRHTEDFIRRFLTDGKRYLMIRDYGGEYNGTLRDDPMNPAKVMGSYGSEYMLGRNRVTIRVYGRNSIMPGETVDLLLDKFAVYPSEIDFSWSGKYLVENAVSEFIEDTYFQKLTLIRGGVGV